MLNVGSAGGPGTLRSSTLRQSHREGRVNVRDQDLSETRPAAASSFASFRAFVLRGLVLVAWVEVFGGAGIATWV